MSSGWESDDDQGSLVGQAGLGRRWVGYAGLVVAGVLLMLGSYVMVMSTYDHNESLYLTAGYLVAQGKSLYADFGFWQMPNSALIYGWVFRITGAERILFTGKVVSLVFLWLAAGGVYAFGFERTRHIYLSAAGAAIFMLNQATLRCAMEASNYIMPITFSIWALVFFSMAWEGSRRAGWLYGAAGCLVNLAVGTKLYYAFAIFPYLAVLAFLPGAMDWKARLKSRFLPFLTGASIGILPAVYYLVKDYDVFMFNNLRAHLLTTEWYDGIVQAVHAQGREIPLNYTLGEKLGYVGLVTRQLYNLGLALGLPLLMVLVGRNRATAAAFRDPLHLLGFALLAVGFFSVLSPTPMWFQYLGTPATFAILLLVLFASSLARESPGWALGILGGIIALQLVSSGPAYVRSLGDLPNSARWPAGNYHELGRLAARVTPSTTGEQRLACWQQIVAAESGRFEPYPELVMSPFSQVIADRLSPEEKRRYHLVGPSDLDAFFAEHPPAAALTGLYENMLWDENDLNGWLDRAGYQLDPKFPALRLYVPPAQGGE